MASRLNWKKIVLVAWAVMLVFMLSHQVAVASASHNSCSRACKRACGLQNCGTSVQVGCNCSYLCKDGTEGSIICVE